MMTSYGPRKANIDTIPAHVWSLTPDGEMHFSNRRVLDYIGLTAEELREFDWRRSVHPEDLAQYVSDRRAALASGQALEKELRIRRADGQYRWWLIRNVPQRNKSGEIVQWYGAGIDIEDKKRADEAALEQRVLERTRIARELHDTLLQSFQAVLLKLHAVTYKLSDRPDVQRTLETLIDQAELAVTEGRDAVQGLRSFAAATKDLVPAIRTLGAELADQGDPDSPEFRVQEHGTPRELAPMVRDQVYRIASEAMHNAFRHAHAGRIEVEISYDEKQLRLCIRDDGTGIDPKFLERGARPGHYGLPGLQERAKLVSGKLTVSSDPGSGTDIELIIPGSVVYALDSGRHAILRPKSAS